MKNRQIIYKIVFAFVMLIICTSCERKDLYHPSQSQLRLITHWEDNIEEKPYYNAVIFYPTDGRKAQRYYLENDTMLLSIPMGEYHVILYNWRTNASAQTDQFKDSHLYTKMSSFTATLTNKTGYFDKYPLFLAPDMLYSWSTEEYGVSKVVTCTLPNEAITTLHTYPKRVVHDYNFHVEVIGLEYIQAVSAVSMGFASQLMMYNKQGTEDDAGHKLNIKVTSTGFECNFSAYNYYKPNDQRLHFVIKLPDGTCREYLRDLNKELDEKGKIEYVEKIVIEYEGSINRPTGGSGFEPPEIGDWEGIEEDIFLPY